MAKSLMIQGTCSNAGKSFVTASLCRLLSNKGLKVAPFKSQNMSRNAYKLKNGDIISSAQAFQCLGARSKPSCNNNPIMLVPNSDVGSRVFVLGKEIGNMNAKEYFKVKQNFRNDILQAYEELKSQNDVIIIEGAGSPAEINLLDGDFVNMGLAEMTDSPVVLVGDIDRGGVFASVYGTIKILPHCYQDRIRGYIINKFRGDIDILTPGIERLSQILETKCLGVLPYIDVVFEEEDSLSKEDSFGLSQTQTESFYNNELEKGARLLEDNLNMKEIFNIIGL